MAISNIRNATNFKRTVLVVDNQPTVLDTHAAILKSLKLNLNIVTTTNPNEALNWINKKQVDLIVTGLSMMHMDGMQLVDAVSRTNSAETMPIIVISVRKDKRLRKKVIAAGASAYLTKPAKPDELSNVARFLLDKKRVVFKTIGNKDGLKIYY